MLDAQLLENLIKALQYENHTYIKLLTIAEKKTEYLVKNDVTMLSEITKDENQMTEQAGQLGKVREHYIAKIAEALGLKSAVSIDEIRKNVTKEQGNMLGDVQSKLRETVLKLTVRNGINQKLIENALNYINFNLQLLASPGPEVPSYGKSGHDTSSGGKRSMLDVRY